MDKFDEVESVEHSEETDEEDASMENNTLYEDETAETEDFKDSFSTSEEYESDDDSNDTNGFENSSNDEEITDESEDTDSHSITDRRRLRWTRNRGNRTGKPNHRKIFKKSWPMRRIEISRTPRFRNPHGAKVQIDHPPPTGRWQRVWQKFNRSKPAQAGRWAGMYNRTQKYWNRARDHTARRVQLRQNPDETSDSEDVTAQWRPRHYTHHNHSHHWHPHNHTHHWHPHNHNHHNHTHHWNFRNGTHHHDGRSHRHELHREHQPRPIPRRVRHYYTQCS